MPEQPPTWWQVVLSVFAAFFGVQSERNRQRDFTKGNFIRFLVTAILSVLLFVLLIIALIRGVLILAGG